jgi:hypothetical protein
MGLKTAALALGVGYVVGAKAGEQHYAQIKELWDHTGAALIDSEPAQRLGQAGKDVGNYAVEALASRARETAERLASSVRERGRVE